MMETRSKLLAITAVAIVAACGTETPNEPVGSGGSSGSGGASSSGGSGSGGKTGSGGSSATGGSSNTGGSSATGGSSNTGGSSATGGSSNTGGSSAKGGTSGDGGATGDGGMTGSGGRTRNGGATGTAGMGSGGIISDGGVTGAGGRTGNGGATGNDAGVKDALGGPEVGPDTGGGGSGGFDPCPATEPCKILPLGDSITWGINYGGGYRIKLFTHTSKDSKNITFVGYDTKNDATAAALNALGDAKSKWVNKHEGHSGWTIQQDDDLVTGKSTANNDGVNYSGKKVVADFDPHIILVHLGTNDMYQNPNGADQRLGTLIDHIVADAPDALVVVSNIIPFPSGASAVTTFNKAVPGVVKQRTDAGKHVIFVDQFAGFQNSDLGSDQVHPNEGGYEKMAVKWYDAIKQYLH